MVRSVILAAAGNPTLRRLITSAPVSRDLVRRFVAGETTAQALTAAEALVSQGLAVTVDHLGEDVRDETGADRSVTAYQELLDGLRSRGLGGRVGVSVKLSALGQRLDPALAVRNAARVCAAADRAGTTVTLDAEDHTTTDATLGALAELRRTWPGTGAVLQAYLYRTLDDCRALAGTGSRVRLCKGAYAEPPQMAYQRAHEVALNFVRCANVLLAGPGYPMFATHDPRLVAIVGERARWYRRAPGSFEFQMLYGIRPGEQRRLAAAGHTVRIYLPYGSDWYAYLVRRVAERPANAALLLRAVLARG